VAAADIPVDLFNPGQVFACLGFLEAADILLGDAEGGFDWSNEGNTRFRLQANGKKNPFEVALTFLSEAEVKACSPARSRLRTDKWSIPTLVLTPDDPFPFPEPVSPATLPAILRDKDGHLIQLEHWGDGTERDNVKFWAGAGGYPGAALARDALGLVRSHLQEHSADTARDPFSLYFPQSSSFRFDWRRDYIPLDVGFSLNEHGDMTMIGFPLVEILAAIGLTNARPERLDKLNYRYGVLGSRSQDRVYSPVLLRVAVGGAQLPFHLRKFRMRLGWPGQENQARCITDVYEEIQS
jgi:CRISPR-associated protein Csx14